MKRRTKQGDPHSFDTNWRNRKETHYNHFTLGAPINQVQLAFRCHFEVFSEILEKHPTSGQKLLETGCGRGTLSNYFAVGGWEVVLLDYNQIVLDVAKSVFETQDLKVKYQRGDVLDLKFPDASFDVVTNIGLLEHFEDIQKVIDEQIRVLKPRGWFFSYVVPEHPENVQKYFGWINSLLKFFTFSWLQNNKNHKPDVFRSDKFSDRYLSCIRSEDTRKIITHGMYPFPMVSHSPEFPFSLLPKPLEFLLVYTFRTILAIRKRFYGRHGWVCNEKFGQAFLIAVQKK